MIKTEYQLLDLKNQWREDPCWDIECTEGFEAYHGELLAWRKEYEATQETIRFERMNKRAIELQCSVALVEYIEQLERRLSQLEQSI